MSTAIASNRLGRATGVLGIALPALATLGMLGVYGIQRIGHAPWVERHLNELFDFDYEEELDAEPTPT